MQRPAMDFFTYEVDFTGANAIAAGATVTLPIQIDASANFKWLYSAYTADIAAAAQTESSRVYPLVNILITPTDTSSQFMSAPVPVPNLFGNGENVFVLPAPRILQANSSLQFQATSYVAAGTTYNLRLSLIGIKIYLG